MLSCPLTDRAMKTMLRGSLLAAIVSEDGEEGRWDGVVLASQFIKFR
jgi:hypothetical protein